MLKITLPLPPSVNRIYRVGRNGRFYKTKQAKDYTWQVLAVMGRDPSALPVRMIADVYLPSANSDLLNRFKVLCDALEDVAYDNDSQIVQAVASKYIDKKNPRVELTLYFGAEDAA